jgi:hypothetical protein
VDQRRHRGDDHQHHRGQRIDAERPVDVERADADPPHDLDALHPAQAEADLDEGDPREDRGDQQRDRGDQLGRLDAGRLRPRLLEVVDVLLVAALGEVGAGAVVGMAMIVAVMAVPTPTAAGGDKARQLGRTGAGAADQRERAGEERAEQRQEDDRWIHLGFRSRMAAAGPLSPSSC